MQYSRRCELKAFVPHFKAIVSVLNASEAGNLKRLNALIPLTDIIGLAKIHEILQI